MHINDLTGKRVLVMGLGRFGGGVDVARFASALGADVTVTDLASSDKLKASLETLEGIPRIRFRLGMHDPADFKQADLVVVNPAVADDNPYLQTARECGATITTQINLFFELCPATIIGITGSNGKSTTTALCAHLLDGALNESVMPYKRAWLSGNIGHQPLLMHLEEMGHDDLVVLELSSFQIERLAWIAKGPRVALLTNLTPNHLDRHGTFARYCAAKQALFRFQPVNHKHPALSLFYREDPIGQQWFEQYHSEPGRQCLYFSAKDVGESVKRCFPLPGRANLDNLAGAMAIARYFGVTEDCMIRSLPSFKALPHRLEFVADIDGVRWYNDSIATTPESVMVALEAFTEPIVLIAGGYDKGVPFDTLGQRIAAKAKAAVLLGKTAGTIARAILSHGKPSLPVCLVSSLEEAVGKARFLAEPGDVVVLSPACASYDMFDNFQERGHLFVKAVKALSGPCLKGA